MTEKLATIISAADEHYLDELIDKDPEVREKWERLRQACMPAGPEKVLERLNKWPQDTAQLLAGKRPATHGGKTRFIKLYKITGAAAAIAIVVLAGWLLFKGNILPDPNLQHLVSRPGSLDHIQLELADGKTVDLSRRQGRISAEGVELTNAGNGLSYQPSTAASGLNTLKVPAGANYSITLDDGTKVWLNSMTTLKFPFEFTGAAREISIEGEAYLKVAENASKPFIVHLLNCDVLVTGTEFNVNTYSANAEHIALVEGSVNLMAANATITLTPGKQAAYNRRSGWTTSSFDANKVLGWRQGLFYFYDATLEDITGVLTRWFGLTVVIDHAAIRERRFAGVLDKNQPLEVFLENMKAIAGIHYYFTEGGRELHFAAVSSGN